MRRAVLAVIFVVVVACLAPLAARAAERPLSQDDVTLLLIGGATTEKMLSLIEQRGVDFQMNPELAKKFHDAGGSDAVIEALGKASEKAKAAPPVAPRVAPAQPATAAVAPASPPSAPKGPPSLSDPAPDEVRKIIQEFAAKEKLFREARNTYIYHQVNKLEELDPDDNPVGMFEQDWDILFDDAGKRIERVTYAPDPTLKGLLVTQEDIDSMRNIQPFVLTTDDLPDYEVNYKGHVRVDEITAYVFSIRPKEMKKGQVYFQGVVWVDDRDLQIVRSEGKTVPEVKAKNGQFNLFPRFTTYREQIDGKFWFPTFTMAKDTLYFPGQPIRIKQVIKYTDYKQFKASSTVRLLGEASTPNSKDTSKPDPSQPKKKN